MVLNDAMSVESHRYILFLAAGGEWAISAAGVAEVLPTTSLASPAGSPRALAGFMNLGGKPLPVVRVSALFDGTEPAQDELYHHILRLTSPDGALQLGLQVERVTDVDAHAQGLAPLSEDQSVNGALVGNLLVGERLVPLLDWGRLLLLEEQQRIADLAAAAQARLAELGDART